MNRFRSALRVGAHLLAPAALSLAAQLGAQQSKKPVTQDVYDRWRTISGATLSADGRWAMYTVSPAIGEGEVVIRSTAGTTEYRAPRGYTGRPQLQAGADSAATFLVQAAQFSGDSRWAAFLAYPSAGEVEAARRSPRGRPVPTPRTSLGLVDLSSGRVSVIPRVRSFRFARDGGRFVAYLLEPDSVSGQRRDAGAARPETGSPLVVRDLASGGEVRLEDATAYLFDDAEHWLAYLTASDDGAKSGAWVRDLASGTTRALAVGKGRYKSLAIDRKGTQVAFVSDRDDQAAPQPGYALYHAGLGSTEGTAEPAPARRVVAAGAAGEGVMIADHGRVEFTRDGTALQFALAPVAADTIPADSLVDKAVYDLWHWQDTRIQPQQRRDAARDRTRTWPAAFLPASGTWTRLGNDSLTRVTLSDDGRVALALNPVEYAVEETWGEGGTDALLVDPATGARTLVAKRLRHGAQLSPGARYVAWFDNGHWWAQATIGGRRVDLTTNIRGVNFADEQFDMPDDPTPYGIGGWTKDDARVLLHDRYDVWEVDPAGTASPRCVTAGAGRRGGVTFRVVNVDPDERFFDPATPLILHAFDNETKASGYARDRLGTSAPPETIVMGPKNYGALQKARKADEYLMTQQTYREFPDLWAGVRIASTTKISDANPQEREYPRGDVELVSWLNEDGVRLQGMLYKPEGFDPSKKYPMITYYYERLSDGLHGYVAPAGRNTVNPMVYTSLGYLVFFPDIVYTNGYPGPSAVKAIVPGVQSLIARGFVDPKRLGIAGQSWGGYQSAYLITATHLFAAAVPNATVVNMTSAYGGIRWGPGILRQFQYEHTQSRIGGSLWEYPERYIENSPLFKLDRVTTPVLFMANDADDAVPWYQGIEFYSAMRRLRKEAYFVVYNGDVHNPTKRANQKDIDRKMQEFFGNKLLVQPAPDWMVRGVPFLQKGRDQVKMGTGATPAVSAPRRPSAPPS